MPLQFPSYSHLYIEKAAHKYPLTEQIRSSFPRAQIVTIDSYRDLFNQPKQNWRLQKTSSKLILAVKHGTRIHPSTEVLPQHAGAPLYYTSAVINCVYDCQYCFLQAMYRSANMIAFVNEEDFYRDAREVAASVGSITLSVSYDADLLGSEKFIPWARRWIEFSRHEPKIQIEIRTKSSNFSLIRDVEPHPGVILSWSLTTESLRTRYERGTATIQSRIESTAEALQRGWRIRLCFDPIIPAGNWQHEYQEMTEYLFSRIAPNQIEDVSVGVFRMGEDHLKNLKARNPHLDLLQANLQHKDSIAALTHQGETPIAATIAALLEKKLRPDQIVLW